MRYLYTSNVDGHLRQLQGHLGLGVKFIQGYPTHTPVWSKHSHLSPPKKKTSWLLYKARNVLLCQSKNTGHPRSSLGFPLCELHGCCEEWLCSAQLAPELDAPRWAAVREAQGEALEGRKACEAPEAFRLPEGQLGGEEVHHLSVF